MHYASMKAITGSSDGTMRLWHLKQGVCLQIFAKHEHSIRSLSVDWAAGLLVSIAAAGPVLLWDINDSAKEPEVLKMPKGDDMCDPPATAIVCLQPRPDKDKELESPPG
jgi:WD40 repeat protein